MRWLVFMLSITLSSGATYYVATNGNNSADGSLGTPWQTVSNGLARIIAGDTLKLMSDQTFSETGLSLTTTGTGGSPITITSSGANKAIISATNGNGLMISNVSYVTINNLEIVGRDSLQGHINWTAGDAAGILGWATNQLCSNINISNCTIHVFGDGIYFYIPWVWPTPGDAKTGKFLNCSWVSNFVHDCPHCSMFAMTYPSHTEVLASTNWYVGYNVCSNSVGDANNGGEGIDIESAYNTLIERNLVTDLGASSTSVGGVVGIEMDYSLNGTIQYNEVARLRLGANGVVDCIGIDLDYRDNGCIVQYNYVHDCDGAAFMHEAQGNNIFRFNVANNCGGKSRQAGGLDIVSISTESSTCSNLSVYNNTFICSTNTSPGIQLDGSALMVPCTGTNIIANNIFITTNGYSVLFTNVANIGLSGNCYYDIAATPKFYWNTNSYATWGAFTNATKQDLTGFTNNPSLASLAEVNNNNANTIQNITNYGLTVGSPLIRAGLNLNSIFGFTMPATDFTGTPIPVTGYSVGAYDSLSPTNYYVDTTNAAASDSNIGSLASPWKTIRKATFVVAPGDSVVIQPGTYSEFVTNLTSGTVASPITFVGIRASDGSWLSVVDPSTQVTNGWVAAPEIGSGVFKYTNLTFIVQEMTINHKDVGFVAALDNTYSNAMNSAFTTVSNGATLMLGSSSQQYTNTQTGFLASYWDGIEALFACTNQSAVYLRLRDGSNPNGLTIGLSPNRDYAYVASGITAYPAWLFSGVGYVTLSNLLVRGAYTAVEITGASHNITVASNYLANGNSVVNVEGGSYATKICDNYITQDYYGCVTPGPWVAASSTNLIAATNGNLYVLGKYLMGADNTAYGSGVVLSECGSSNLVYSNHIYSGTANGVNMVSATPMTNTYVYGNHIENYPSAGLISQYGQVGTRFYDNFVGNCNANMRWNDMDRDNEYTNRLSYIYRNTFWLPDNVGEHLFVHWYGGATVPANYPTYWVYQNSFSGGHDALDINPSSSETVSNCFFLNNVFNSYYYVYSSIGFWTNAAQMGLFDYNELVPPIQTYPSSSSPVWFGTHNLTNSALEWSYASEPNFRLGSGSVAINHGLDIPTIYPTLPQDATVKVGTAWDIGALEYVPPQATANTLHAGTLRSP